MLDADQLIDAFSIQKGITSVIGGGGKTSLISFLASALSGKGSVIITTTTHILYPNRFPFAERINQPLARHEILVTGIPCENGKLKTPAQSLESLANFADYVLVEADGAKGLPLKAHASYEPVIPPESSCVIAVMGLDGIGRRISESAHRPELYASIAKASADETVTPAIAVCVIKTYPSVTAVVLNKADNEKLTETGRAVASYLDVPTAIMSIHQKEPIIEIWRNHKCWLS